jgi:3-deoxy-D-manno-octulosonic-acid transferase
MAKFRTDQQQLDFLSARITRLQATLERIETLGMTSTTSAGNTKVFMDLNKVKLELDRAEQEFNIISARMEGTPINPTFKQAVICQDKNY